MSDSTTTYVIRLSGTVSTKASRTRKRFTRRLVANIRDALDRHGIAYDLEREWARLFVETDDERAGGWLRRICGVQGVRPSHRVEWESLDDLVRVGRRMYGDRVDGRSFAVDASRVGQRGHFGFDSMDVNRELGGALDEAGGSVDLDDPQIAVRLEVHPDRAFFFDEELPGPGGLPIGTEGRALALISGGFDSAVAAWTMLKRGVALDFVFFNLGGPPHERGVRRVLADLTETWLHGADADLHVVDFRPILAELKSNVPGSYWQVVLKRTMLRAADRIADEHSLPALVTGEAIGQVSSQTLANLAAIEAPVERPVFRPLSGHNKEEIVALAREIEVHDEAESVPEFCALEGGKPVTNTTSQKLDRQEEKMALELIARLVEDRRRHDARALSTEIGEPDVQVDQLPSDATLLDLRSETEFESWHPPDAVHVPFETALDQYPMLPETPKWVLYCDVGLKSALVAEKMRQAGFEAYSFRGGVPKLRRELEGANHSEG